MPDLPSHASAYYSPQPLHPNKLAIAEFSLNPNAITPSPSSNSERQTPNKEHGDAEDTPNGIDEDISTTPALPNSILSPAFTPPLTPGNLSSAFRQSHTADS